MEYNVDLGHEDGLVQDCTNSIAKAVLLESCSKPSISCCR